MSTDEPSARTQQPPRWLLPAGVVAAVVAVAAAVIVIGIGSRADGTDAAPETVSTSSVSTGAASTSTASTAARLDQAASYRRAAAPPSSGDPTAAGSDRRPPPWRTPRASTTPEPTLDITDAVSQGVEAADDRGRHPGGLGARPQHRPDRGVRPTAAARFDTMSVTKLFTATYYLVQADGQPDAELSRRTRADDRPVRRRHPDRALGLRHRRLRRRPVRPGEHVRQRVGPGRTTGVRTRPPPTTW